MLEKLAAAYSQGRLILQGSLAKLAIGNAFAALLKPLRRKNWFVYAKRPFAGPKAVLAYLSRYTHQVAISNARLIAHDGRGVSFRYKDYRADGLARHKVMTLATDEFIRRFMLHILPKGFHRIRHYGLFASVGRAANLARLRELLGALPPEKDAASPAQDQPAETVLPPCPCCGGRMAVIEVFARGTLPSYRPFSAAVIWFDTS